MEPNDGDLHLLQWLTNPCVCCLDDCTKLQLLLCSGGPDHSSPLSSQRARTHTPLRMKTLDGRHVPTGQVLNCIAADLGLWPLLIFI